MSAPVQPGDILAGKYRVERVLGQGGMGVVVAAMHLQLSERVALKFLLPSAAQNVEFNARFQREAQVTAKLRNEHVTRVSDIGVLETGAPFMVMEYLEGVDLRQILKERGPLPLDEAVDLILQATEGVAEAHSLGFVHRDLKPSNLFLTVRRDGSILLKVLDFGISKALGTEDEEELQALTTAGSILGSVRYIAPEQLRNSKGVDARADVWSLGAILFEMLTGRPPFQAESTPALCMVILNDTPAPKLRAFVPDVPEELEQVLTRCLAKNPDDRYQDISDFATALTMAVPAPKSRMSLERIRGMMTLSSTGMNPTLSSTLTGSYPTGSGLGSITSQAISASSSARLRLSSEPSVVNNPVATSKPASPPEPANQSNRRSSFFLFAAAVAILSAVILYVATRGSSGQSSNATGGQTLPAPSQSATAASNADPTSTPSATAPATTTAPTVAPSAADSSSTTAGPSKPSAPDRPSAPTGKRPPVSTSPAKDTKPHVNPLEDRQ